MNVNQDSVAQLARRRALFTRITAARNASSHGTAERARLEDVCERSATRLTESANTILQTLGGPALPYGPLKKWRIRLSRELSSLRSASSHLSACLKTVASSSHADDTFADAAQRKKVRNIEETDCKIGASQLDKARQACAFVSREIPQQLPLSLRHQRNTGVTNEAVSVVSKVLRKVARYLRQVTEELALLAAADAEMKLTQMQAKCSSASTSKKKENMAAGYGYSVCQLVDLKGALGLLIALS